MVFSHKVSLVLLAVTMSGMKPTDGESQRRSFKVNSVGHCRPLTLPLGGPVRFEDLQVGVQSLIYCPILSSYWLNWRFPPDMITTYLDKDEVELVHESVLLPEQSLIHGESDDEIGEKVPDPLPLVHCRWKVGQQRT